MNTITIIIMLILVLSLLYYHQLMYALLYAFLAVMAIGFSYHVLFTFPSLLVARAKGLFINFFDKEEPSLKETSFLSCQCLKINPSFKVLQLNLNCFLFSADMTKKKIFKLF